AGMNAAVELFLEVGPATAAARIAEHAARIIAWSQGRAGVRLVSSPEPRRRSGIVAIIPRDAERASAALGAAGVGHSLREGAIRLSPHWFTPREHVDLALEVLEEAARYAP